MLPHKKLVAAVGDSSSVYIQTHNFPEHDAVASGFALQFFLKHFDKEGTMIYEGEVLRDSLKRMIEELGIDIRPVSRCTLSSEDKIIVVGGCKGNKNVASLSGVEV